MDYDDQRPQVAIPKAQDVEQDDARRSSTFTVFVAILYAIKN